MIPPWQDSGGLFWLCSRLPSGDFCSWSSEADLWVCESIWVVLWGTEHMFLSTAVQWQRILSLHISKNTIVCHLLRRNITHRVHFSGELQSSQPFLSFSSFCALLTSLWFVLHIFFLQRNTINLLKAFHTHTLHSSTSATVSFSPNRFRWNNNMTDNEFGSYSYVKNLRGSNKLQAASALMTKHLHPGRNWASYLLLADSQLKTA